MLLPSGETRNYINIRKERSRFWDRSSLSPVLPEVVTELLPPVDKYTGGVGFCGTRDVRVMERAKTLRITTWLHRLDMAVVEGDQIASQTLEAA